MTIPKIVHVGFYQTKPDSRDSEMVAEVYKHHFRKSSGLSSKQLMDYGSFGALVLESIYSKFQPDIVFLHPGNKGQNLTPPNGNVPADRYIEEIAEGAATTLSRLGFKVGIMIDRTHICLD